VCNVALCEVDVLWLEASVGLAKAMPAAAMSSAGRILKFFMSVNVCRSRGSGTCEEQQGEAEVP
jgi:hypothetical protein